MHSLEVTDLKISIGGRAIVNGTTFHVGQGQRVCLLGESGSGKSLTASAVLGQLPRNAVTSGSIKVNGIEVLGVPASKRANDARVAMVFQDSAVALNPLVRMREQLVEPLRRHRGLSRVDALELAVELAESVGLPDPENIIDRFPAELSGGQRQRVCIALALACNTRLMVADEPTTALDVVTQKRVLEVLKKYTAGQNTPALLFITHDFAVASELCSDAVVMKDGDVVERGNVHSIFAAPRNPYTRELIRAARSATVEPYIEKFRDELAALREQHEAPALERKIFFDIANVSREYAMPRKRPFAPREMKPALNLTSLVIGAGERVGIVGVSGSGKTTLLRIMLALESTDTGAIVCTGKEVYPAEVKQLKWYRRKVQYVPQDPASTLDPLMTVQGLVKEPLVRLGVQGNHDEMVSEALHAVNLDDRFLNRRANELSGGQAQRLAIARAIATRPDFLLADEPVSGLDLPMRESIVSLMRQVSQERGTGIVVVSHDLSMVASLCERTIVMHGGDVVEDRPTKQLLTSPRHPRTRELLDAIPNLHMVPEGLEIPA
ncbi:MULTISPECIES: ABC transporter ATP-binding protein [unclassified Leucobacter]|uniref:ATP-binding cassette domain-containing protein n=1 Tax=unclassified Leucobacter TaxID=2621730 RepID=UPI00165DBE1D|nr:MULTISPECIES: ABC transporter ATP-binding protein [unclassified Leucobacter]MBC9936293.1 ABC transporter ATP-binding protein [Leucobacter sp. cx-87]